MAIEERSLPIVLGLRGYPDLERSTQGDCVGAAEQASLAAICELLKTRAGHDLSAYKQGPLLQGFARRMATERHGTFSGYLEYLEGNPQAIQLLIRDLLVSVTRFFRDPEMWQELKSSVLGPLVESASAGSPLRIWVIACSTGEEAYSLAISLDEEFESRGAQRNYSIFATDCHPHVLATARAGAYSHSAVAAMGSKRVERYFRAQNGQYLIEQDIRSRISFTQHNVLNDVPLTGLNLISCRNMLMFLRSQSQQQLGDVFRHALRAQGFLFLGDSERVCSPFFFPLDGNPAIYTHLIGVPTKSSRVRILDGLGNSSCTEPDINATGRTQSSSRVSPSLQV